MSRFSSFFRPILTTLLLFSAVSLSGFCPEAPEAAGLPPQETLRSIGASMEAADTASFSKLVDLCASAACAAVSSTGSGKVLGSGTGTPTPMEVLRAALEVL